MKSRCLIAALAFVLATSEGQAQDITTGIDTFIQADNTLGLEGLTSPTNGIGNGLGCCGGAEVPVGTPLSQSIGLEGDNLVGAQGGPANPLLFFDLSGEPSGPGTGTLAQRWALADNPMASLQLVIPNDFNNSDVTLHKAVVDWHSDVDSVATHNNLPTSPSGLFGAWTAAEGVNTNVAVADVSATIPLGADLVNLNVTDDVNSWLTGASENHGWLFVNPGTNGGYIASFDNPSIPARPVLSLSQEDGQDLPFLDGTVPPADIVLNTGVDTFIQGDNTAGLMGDSSPTDGIGNGLGCCGGAEVPVGTPLSQSIGLEGDNLVGAQGGPANPLVFFDLDVEPDGEGTGTLAERWAAADDPSATLRLVIPNTFNNSDVSLHRAVLDWHSDVDSDATFNALPTSPSGLFGAWTAAEGVNTNVAVTEISAIIPEDATAVELDVTADLSLWLTGAAENHGWLFVNPGSNGGYIASFDNPVAEFRPTLTLEGLPQVSATVIPEPTSVVFWSILGVGLTRLGRVRRLAAHS